MKMSGNVAKVMIAASLAAGPVAHLAFAASANQAGRAGDLVIPTRITVDPADSFRRGQSITIKATFRPIPRLALCQDDQWFAVRIYDPKVVPAGGPLYFEKTQPPQPLTPYIAQAGTPYDPPTGADPTKADKTFETFVMPIKKTARLSRLFIGLFHTCGRVDTPKTQDGTTVIGPHAGTASYIGGTFFRADCGKKGPEGFCTYRPE
jgi:hypothetical protein